MPIVAVASILWEAHEDRFSVVVVGNRIFLSAHILDYASDRSGDSPTLRQLSAAIQTAKDKVVSKDWLPVALLGVDGNVTLPPNYSNITGPACARALPSHRQSMQQSLLEFLNTHDLFAHNTFPHAPGLPLSTRVGRKRSVRAKSQIDFVCSTIDKVLPAYADAGIDVECSASELCKSDHLPVRLRVEIEENEIVKMPEPGSSHLRKIQEKLHLSRLPVKAHYWYNVSHCRADNMSLQDCFDGVQIGHFDLP